MKSDLINGVVKRHPDGYGFLIPHNSDHSDVYIPSHFMKGVMSNDQVSIQLIKRGKDVWGEITKIHERAHKRVSGKFQILNNEYGIIFDQGHAWGEPLKISKQMSMSAKQGDWIVAEVISYPENEKSFEGRVIELIGKVEDPLNDIKRVISYHAIPSIFSKDTIEEANSFGKEVDFKELKNRVDLRDKDFFTIDGMTAKDFDDAIYVESSHEGFTIWVGIADVSHYVKSNSSLDKEAYARGNSTYFPNFVVPMLPENLSNELCSLKPHLPRLVVIAELKLDFSGEVISSKFYEGVIESKSRLTYGEAQEIIDGEPIEKHVHVAPIVSLAADVAKILMFKRFREGSMELDIPETEIIVNELEEPIDIVRAERVFSHKVIEEFMLIANVSVAKFLSDGPSIYRVHEAPPDGALAVLQRFIHNFGSKKFISGNKIQSKITKALDEFQGRPEGLVLNILTLRSMSQAKYSSHNLGHFGLGFSHYTHFTSPIRRYADLMVHRLLKIKLAINSHYVVDPELLQSISVNLTACEQRSAKAERQWGSIKKARFISKHVGETFEGIISSVVKFGLFVALREFDIDGLIKIDTLGQERFDFDEENLRLVGRKSKETYKIGDLCHVQVVSSNSELGQIDFLLLKGHSKDQFHKENRKKVKNKKEIEKGKKQKKKFKKFKREKNIKEKIKHKEKFTK